MNHRYTYIYLYTYNVILYIISRYVYPYEVTLYINYINIDATHNVVCTHICIVYIHMCDSVHLYIWGGYD